MRCAIALCGLSLLVAAPARADGGAEAWPTLSVTKALGDKWSGSVETLARLSRAPGQAAQFRWRVQIARHLSSRVTVALSGGHLITYNDGKRDGIEDQLVEQLNWTIGKIGPVAISARTRLEQRFIVGNDGLAWRFREQLRLVAPVKGTPFSAVLWSEPFFALNHTNATQYSFDQIRNFAGVSWRLSPHADVEFGYLHQHLHRPTGDVNRNVVPVVMNLHF